MVRSRRPPAAPCRTATSSGLIGPRSKINGETPEFVEAQHFLLDLPALAEALAEWLENREASGAWRPNVIRFSQNILKEIRAAGDDPRHRLGDRGAAGRLPRQPGQDSSTSGSTR